MGVFLFGFSVWGAETCGCGVGEVCKYEGDGVYGICRFCCCDRVSETEGVSIIGSIMGVFGGGGSKIDSDICWKNIEMG